MEISRIIVFTPDVDGMVRFYTSCFGLSTIGDANADWTELEAGSCRIAFHRIDEHSESRDGWIKIVFGAKDVATEKLRLENLGIEMSDIVEFGDIKLCDGRDSDGNWFQISSRGM